MISKIIEEKLPFSRLIDCIKPLLIKENEESICIRWYERPEDTSYIFGSERLEGYSFIDEIIIKGVLSNRVTYEKLLYDEFASRFDFREAISLKTGEGVAYFIDNPGIISENQNGFLTNLSYNLLFRKEFNKNRVAPRKLARIPWIDFKSILVKELDQFKLEWSAKENDDEYYILNNFILSSKTSKSINELFSDQFCVYQNKIISVMVRKIWLSYKDHFDNNGCFNSETEEFSDTVLFEFECGEKLPVMVKSNRTLH